VRFINLSEIIVPSDRQREEFDPIALAELRDSITGSSGLLHPPVVRREGSRTLLVAGERRLRAILDAAELGILFKYNGEFVPTGMVPVNDIGELSHLERMEAEYEENMRRVDLSWSERAKATSLLMELRSAQAAAEGLPTPAISSISLEVRGSAEGINHTSTRNEILITKHLSNPEVAAAKTLKEAVKIVQRQETAARNVSMAERLKPTILASAHRLLNLDSLAWMESADAAQFDVVLTDPPYGMGADEFGDSGKTGGSLGSHFYNDSYQSWKVLIHRFAFQSWRLTKEDAHAYVFCDLDNFHELRKIMVDVGWTCFRTPIIWHKPGNFRAPWPDKGPQRKYETCLYAVRGKKTTTKLAPDVISFNSDSNLGHPAQKPVDLYTDLLSRSAQPGDKVFDPFCGTGPVLEAAHRLHCIATAIELDTGAFGIAASRLASISNQAQKDLL
jgi:site-specific DNA-methyltransferase (adenine-specific)